MSEQELNKYIEYIRRELKNKAQTKFPIDQNKQLAYQIGFLQAQLAHAMYEDSRTLHRFKSNINTSK